MARVIAFVNQKGGVGKTTATVNTAAALAEAGKHVLLIDLDPQANASSGLGVFQDQIEHHLYHALLGEKKIDDIIHKDPALPLYVIPSGPALSGANIELVEEENREQFLRKLVDEVRHLFDYILIDCPPSLGLLTINGLVAADEVVIPVQAEYYALEGLGQLLETIGLIQESLRPELVITGALLTMFDRRVRLSDHVMMQIEKHFPHRVFTTSIPRSIRLAEAPSFGQHILAFDAQSKGARAFRNFAKELIATENAEAGTGRTGTSVADATEIGTQDTPI